MDSPISLQLLPHLSVAIGAEAFALLPANCFAEDRILFRTVHPFYKAVIAALRYSEELAYDKDRILFPVPVNHCILYQGDLLSLSVFAGPIHTFYWGTYF